jgi:hypothetical protein
MDKPALTKEDIIKIRESYDIVEVADRLGLQLRSASGGYRCQCPFHGSRDMDFHINPTTQLAGCWSVGCIASLDVIGLVREINHCTFADALTWLESRATRSGGGRAPVQHHPKIAPFDPQKQQWMQRRAEDAHRNNCGIAASYWTRRGLTHSAISYYKLGAIDGYTRKETYTTLSGEVFYALPHRRYTIPWVGVDGKVNAIAQRIDQKSAEAAIEMMPESVMQSIKEDFYARLWAYNPKNVIEKLVGPRYLTTGSKAGRIFNARQFINEQREVSRYPFAFLDEGEANCAAITHVAGYPAASLKHTPHMGVVFAGVEHLVIVQNRDEPQLHMNGKIIVPGEQYAQVMVKQSGRTLNENIHIIVPPYGYNDPMDLAEDGYLKDWLDYELRRIGISVKHQQPVPA